MDFSAGYPPSPPGSRIWTVFKHLFAVGKLSKFHCLVNPVAKKLIHTTSIFRPYFKPQQTKFRINDAITARHVRAIGDSDENLGLITIEQARTIAKERGVDVIQITLDPETPVVRIMSFGKFKYQQEKQEKKHKPKEKKTSLKTVRISLVSQLHDLEVKVKQAEKFLEQARHVQIDLMLRGRQKAHQDLAREKIKKFLTLIKTPIKIDQERMTPRGPQITISKS